MTIAPEAPTTLDRKLKHLELEITGRCQLACTHCYAESGPTQGHGSMTPANWMALIDEAVRLGTKSVQFIGGEPTLHPAFAELVTHALNGGLAVRVYSNFYRVKPEHWDLYTNPRVSLATSYYSDQAAEHDAITGRDGSHALTRGNIVEAVRRNIPLKVAIIRLHDDQRTAEARVEMLQLGVHQVRTDDVRAIGNAATERSTLPSTSALCGKCGDDKAAVLPDGTVAPCVMARFLPAGTVQGGTLANVLDSEAWKQITGSIRRTSQDGCTPDEDSCMPSPGASPITACNPNKDGSDCAPAETTACAPKYDFAPSASSTSNQEGI
ncbi:radical SAM/SPASM domain-containing protein [Streptomyces anulatus]|uniref:radical SAM/SPASM domain-containing protein n=1 Tax=Streptomyces anulatus TaxID=1892 RepID=UPI00365FD15B